MTYREFLLWTDFYSVDPFGERRADYRNAQLASIIANQNRDKKKRAKPYTLRDFLIFDDSKEAARAAHARTGKTKVSPETLTYLFVRSGAKQKPPPKE